MPLRVFPVSSGARFTDDYMSGRVHEGNDLFAAKGTPLLAVDDGEIRFGSDDKGGNIANLYASDGTRYYYAHLSGFRGESRRRVKAGEVIGYLGDSGNATGTSPHVHFEMHPGNGAAVDPFPYLERAPRGAPSDALERIARAAFALGVIGAGVAIFAPQTFRKLVS